MFAMYHFKRYNLFTVSDDPIMRSDLAENLIFKSILCSHKWLGKNLNAFK